MSTFGTDKKIPRFRGSIFESDCNGVLCCMNGLELFAILGFSCLVVDDKRDANLYQPLRQHLMKAISAISVCGYVSSMAQVDLS